MSEKAGKAAYTGSMIGAWILAGPMLLAAVAQLLAGQVAVAVVAAAIALMIVGIGKLIGRGLQKVIS